MRAQHTPTPGPWDVDKTLNQIRGADKTKAAVCGACYNSADQHLIAAAPDMLNALITALPYVENAMLDEGYKQGAVEKVVRQMRAAITKAMGETS